MQKWQYQIQTIHLQDLIDEDASRDARVIQCAEDGTCFVGHTSAPNREDFEKILDEQGKEGWELVHISPHSTGFLCIWKRIVE